MKRLYNAWRDRKIIYETEKAAQNIFRKLGFNITRAKYGSYNEEPITKLLRHHEINLVLDIGANTGQYASSLISSGYNGQIVSFEPQTAAHDELTRKAGSYPNWKVAERCAIGEKDGETEIHISKNSVSSSVLPILKAHTEAEPSAGFTRSEKVKMHKLDTLAGRYITPESRVFAKIDVQGYQEQVLKGAAKTLLKISGMQLECSLTKLYEGEAGFVETIEKAGKLGFELHDIMPGFRNNKTGRLLQADCVFFRQE